MDDIEQYDTLVEAIEALHSQGYVEDFNLKKRHLECHNGEIKLLPKDFEIDKVFRFYSASDVDDESILYAISSEQFNLKGLLVNGYGATAETPAPEMMEKLK